MLQSLTELWINPIYIFFNINCYVNLQKKKIKRIFVIIITKKDSEKNEINSKVGIKYFKWHFKNTYDNFSNFDNRFEFSSTKIIRNTLLSDEAFFSKFNIGKQHCAL